MTTTARRRRPGPISAWVPRLALAVVALLGLSFLTVATPAASALTTFGEACPPGTNPVTCENGRPGTPPTTWDVIGVGDETIQGFTTEISVDVGERVDFKIDTDAADYRLEIYRLGWYGGDGARLVDTVSPSATLPQTQPACLTDPTTNLLDCGNWGVSASWDVPSDAVSGVYVGRPVRADTGGDSHVAFVVRDDARPSDVLFQTSDTTWQAYNLYGGSNLYGGPNGRATKVSYNRPFTTRADVPDGRDWLFANEYPMIRFLERNGYDVSYITGIDAHRDGAGLLDHEVFLSVGHDEYWSGPQRAHVEAARDAGVDLGFFSGNEVYWRTRYEPSIDGSATDLRTLVSYKETLDGERTDPTPEWTGTWRDPRFTSTPNGDYPENALTGTAYMSNSIYDQIEVPAELGRTRFWRNTSVASLAPGEVATLVEDSLGYESNEDLDNGFRPPGLFHVSSTTAPTPELLQDFGSQVAPGTTTHTMTTYRAPSGALVFSAGTIQWTWGLDSYHDGPGPALYYQTSDADPRMQQATVNLLADMGAQPATLMPGLVAATASTDATAPTATITSPVADAALANGSLVAVTGTAADAGGGVVAGVEVSLDGGDTWHPADGRETWSYSGHARGDGEVAVQARAVDDSGNLGTPAEVRVDVSCPCSIFGDAEPTEPPADDTTAVELGVRFVPQRDGVVHGIRFYKGEANTGTHVGTLWSATGEALARATFTGKTATGWQEVEFPPVDVTAGTEYVASYYAPQGGYHAELDALFREVDAEPLTVPDENPDRPTSMYALGNAFPDSSVPGTNYYVDVLFSDSADLPPTIANRTPAAGSASNPLDTPVTVAFSSLVDQGTVTAGLTAPGDVPVPAQVDVADADGATTVTITPDAPLQPGTTYTVSVDADSATGVPMPVPATWTVTTTRGDLTGACPCALFPDVVPTGTSAQDDGTPVELGVAFTPDESGTVEAVRFLAQADAPASQVALWSASGQLLAEAPAGEPVSAGWQEVPLDPPVTVTAGEQYVASYRAPTGRYPATPDGFGPTGVDRTPLTAATDAGRYTYAVGQVPGSTSTANYWVDVVFEEAADTFAPVAAASSPPAGATSVPTGAAVTVTFDEPVATASLTAGITRDGTAVPATLSTTEDAPGEASAATLTPDAALDPDTVYQVSVSATDLVGNAMDVPATWTFRTARVVTPGECPCGLFDDTAPADAAPSGETQPVTLGVRFAADQDGTVTGVRFYKDVADTGTHVGYLWSAAGDLLAEATFTGESTAGWQTATFAEPVRVTAGTEYVVAYRSPTGAYVSTVDGFGAAGLSVPPLATSADSGMFTYDAGAYPGTRTTSNYWVDALFVPEPPDLDPPTVIATTPPADATDVDTGTTVRATFAAPVEPGTVELAVTDADSGDPVAGQLAVDATAGVATFTPSAPLATEQTLDVTVSGARSTGGTAMTPFSWQFTTGAGQQCPCTLFGDAAPVTESADDDARVELGTRFTAAVDGTVTGVRIYRGEADDSTYIGRLWTTGGEELASVTVTGGASAGWQTLPLDAPVPVTAGTEYVVSYVAPDGGYAVTSGFFDTPWERGPLAAPGTSNGVYQYGGGFPAASWLDSNYFVDVEFEPAATTAPSVAGQSPPPGATAVAPGTPVTATFSEPVVPDSAAVTVSAGGGDVAGATEYDPASRTVTFRPDADLPADTLVTVSVAATGFGGSPLAGSTTWTFTTGSDTLPPGQCPCSLLGEDAVPDVAAGADTEAVELGLRFEPLVDGQVTAVRFYKGPGNGGTHVGRLWSAGGTELASVTFTGETDTGWQTGWFDTPVDVTAGTEYVVSYLAPQGRYAITPDAFTAAATVSGPLVAPGPDNGVFRYGGGFPDQSFRSSNYFVDVVFDASGAAGAPTVEQVTPAADATGVDVSSPVTVRFSRPVVESSVDLALTRGTDAVAGTASYDAGTRTATFTPDEPLPAETALTASVAATGFGGQDLGGTTSWTFTTAAVVEPVSLFGPADTPAVPAAADPAAIELGVRFVPDTDGLVTGVRFFRGPGNDGTHVGTLWNAAGEALASVTFTDETASGWQTAVFATPVPVTAGTEYVASYLAPQGRYSVTADAFTETTAVGPLTVPGPANGVYRYGGGFPSSSFRSTNYWVDVVYRPL